MKRFLCIGMAVVLLFTLAACGGEKEQPLSRHAVVMDTVCSVKLYDNKEEAVLDAAFALAEDYAQLWLSTSPDSDIARLNAANGTETTVDAATYALLQTAQFYTITTDGAFDVTAGALTELWQTAHDRGTLPTEAELNAAVFTVGGYRYGFGVDTVTVEQGTMLDLGGIAAGAVVDQLAQALKAGGCNGAVIDFGGNIAVIGSQTNGEPFEIELYDPYNSAHVIGAIKVSDRAVATSNAYSKTYEIGGEWYPHVFNPKTGMPVQNDLAAVTILAPQAVDADVLSTACLVMGYEKANAFLKNYADVDAVFIKQDGTVIVTDGVERVE